MPLTVFLLLSIFAFICVVMHILNYIPLWIAVLLVIVIELLRAMPLGH
jgi:hypothetical protein